MPACTIRDSEEADISAIAAIYGHWVANGLASFELEPPSVAEMRQRRAAVLAGGYPYLVAADGEGRVVGYAYASVFRPRPAYRFSCENSIYVAKDAHRAGIGRSLLNALIARCEAQGLRLMVAVIGDSGNASSIALHTACGFTMAGILPATGWKHGRWVDTVQMTRPLGAGATAPPLE